MNKGKIIKTIENLESLLLELKGQLGFEMAKSITPQARKINWINKSKKKSGLAKSILELRNRGFMDTSKTALDLSKEFKKQALGYDTDTIRTALMRLVRKGLLEREGEGITKSPWKYKKR